MMIMHDMLQIPWDRVAYYGCWKSCVYHGLPSRLSVIELVGAAMRRVPCRGLNAGFKGWWIETNHGGYECL